MIKYLTILIWSIGLQQSDAQTAHSDYEQTIELVSPELNKYTNVRDFFISPTEDEAYFTIQSPNQDLSKIVCVKNKKWKNPIVVSFCDSYSYLEPFLSPDGKRLYFASDRPKTESETSKSDFDIWFVERKDQNSAWSKPINIGSPVNSENNEFYPTLADNNNLYFTMEANSGLGKDDIYFCKWDGASYSKPLLLSININSEGYEFNAFISKDENMLLFTKYNAKDGFGSGDLYVSKKDEQGEWKPAKNIGNKINTKYMEYCPFYDAQSNTLYFTSKRSNLSPKTFKDLSQFQDYISGSENGSSKIYKCKIKF
jgi:Tol biopolymer transport system component